MQYVADDLFIVFSPAQRCSAWPASGFYHLGGHPAVPCLPPDLHLHLLLLPWATEWPQHNSQELVHQPFCSRTSLPHWHQPDWPAGKRQNAFCSHCRLSPHSIQDVAMGWDIFQCYLSPFELLQGEVINWKSDSGYWREVKILACISCLEISGQMEKTTP